MTAYEMCMFWDSLDPHFFRDEIIEEILEDSQ
ncbi:hypothetical protein LCGC14_2067100 [marine sediment metagenome]|uniref:Uncharacterized protein n=1 Tax=marine sediment metagenome TaxID=412755 RepID=A0A0F9GY05_9ZZZZ